MVRRRLPRWVQIGIVVSIVLLVSGLRLRELLAARVAVSASVHSIAAQPPPKASHTQAHDRAGQRPATPKRVLPSKPFVLSDTERALSVLVYPPQRDAPRQPLTVMLHGMCDEPANECPYFAEAVTPRGWLVCPRARLRCEGGGQIWDYRRRHETLEESVQLLVDRYPDAVDEAAGRTLLGFSLGGIFGMDVAHRAKGRYPRVVLIGAKVHPSAALLTRAGVKRLVLAAGDWDMMHGHMQNAARRTNRAGLPTRFVSMGKIGHWFPDDVTTRMNGVLDWVSAEE